MWYAYVGPGIIHVCNNFSTIDKLAAIFPYSKFRKCKTEDDAWEFIARFGKRPELKNVVRYGDTFNTHFVTVEYMIAKDSVYYNVKTSQLGYIRLESSDENFVIENRTELIKVKLKNIFLNKDLVSAHAIAIYHIVRLLGNYVDVEIKVPDHSIFYMLTSYNGTKTSITKVRKFLASRKGKVSVTLLNWKQEFET